MKATLHSSKSQYKAVFLKFQFRLFSTFIFVIALFCRCQNSSPVAENPGTHKEIKMKTVSFKNLSALMPADYPAELIDFSYGDLQYISLNTEAKNNLNLREVTGNSFDEIVLSVRSRYPDFDNAAPEEYARFFPTLSRDEIIEYQETVFQYVEKLMGYEVAISVATLRNKRTSSTLRTAYGTNSCEEWYYAMHLRLDKGGMQKAHDLALQKAGTNTNDRQDANRHAVWNVYLGKYAAYRYGSVNEAMAVVQGLTEAHECDTPQIEYLSKDMDLFNNLVGLQYFTQIAQKYKKNIFDYNVKVNKTDDEIFNYIKSLNARIVANSAEINNGSPLTILVKLL